LLPGRAQADAASDRSAIVETDGIKLTSYLRERDQGTDALLELTC
jgi:hypothetical protein